jgi:hypothetical protein
VQDFAVQITGASLGLTVQQHHHENMWLLVVEASDGSGEASAQGVLDGDILKSVAGVSIHSLSQTLGMLPAEMAGNQLKQMVSALITGSPRPLQLGFQRVGTGSSLGAAALAAISQVQQPAATPAATLQSSAQDQQIAEQQQELQRLQAELKGQRDALVAEKEQWQEQQQWAQEQQEQQQTQEQASGLTFRSQPVWAHPSFSPMVANAFLPQQSQSSPAAAASVEDSSTPAGVERGTPQQQLNWSLSLVSMMVKRLLAERLPSHELPHEQQRLFQTLTSALTALSTAETFSGLLPAGRNHDKSFLDYLHNIVARVQQLPMGGVLVIPGGWTTKGDPRGTAEQKAADALSQQHMVMYVLYRHSDLKGLKGAGDFCSFSVVNTGADGSSQFHAMAAEDGTANILRNIAFCIDNIPLRKLSDCSFWYMLLRLIAYTPTYRAKDQASDQFSAPRVLYSRLLPYLNQMPLLSNVAAAENYASTPTAPVPGPPAPPGAPAPPAGGAAVAPSFFRPPILDWRKMPIGKDYMYVALVLETLFHTLRLLGSSASGAQLALVLIQDQLCRVILNDLQLTRSLSSSDACLLSLACRSLARAASSAVCADSDEAPGDAPAAAAAIGKPATSRCSFTPKQLRKLLGTVREINNAIARLRGSADSCSAAHACLCLMPDLVPGAERGAGLAAAALAAGGAVGGVATAILEQIGSGSTVFPLFGRFRRDCSVEGLAGGAPVPPIVLPVELSLLPDAIASYEDVCTALHDANRLCTALANQSHLMRYTYCLRASLLAHLFIRLVPLPLPTNHPRRARECFWGRGAAAGGRMKRNTQLDLLQLLHQLSRHFVTASLSLHCTHSFDCTRIVTMACIATVADAVARKIACDVPSVFSLHYSGRAAGPGDPFGFDLGHLLRQTAFLRCPDPWLVTALTQVLDYNVQLVDSLKPGQTILSFYEPAMKDIINGSSDPAESASAPKTRIGNPMSVGDHRLLDQLCLCLGLDRGQGQGQGTQSAGKDPYAKSPAQAAGISEVPAGGAGLPRHFMHGQFFSGERPELLYECPALMLLRDVVFLLKCMISPSSDELPELKRWMPIDAELKWVFKEHKPKRNKAGRPQTPGEPPPATVAVAAVEGTATTEAQEESIGEIDSGWPFKRQDLQDFYEMHDPTKIPYIDQIFVDYVPEELLSALRSKYGSTPIENMSGPKVTQAVSVVQPDSVKALGLSGTVSCGYFEVRGFARTLTCPEPISEDTTGVMAENMSAGREQSSFMKRWSWFGLGKKKPRVPPSNADPSSLAGTRIDVEEDVLHIPSSKLPDFDGLLHGREVELLLQYLTVPYLRIPLVLAFFAEPSRITTLRCIKLQKVLDACLFEPGPWRSPLYDAQKGDTKDGTHHIPARTRAPLATPSGLLLNELMHQPAMAFRVVEMLEISLELDGGSFSSSVSSSASAILFVVRMAVRVQGYILFLLRHKQWRAGQPNAAGISTAANPATTTDGDPAAFAGSGSGWRSYVRGLHCADNPAAVLMQARQRLTQLLQGPVRRMLQRWCNKARVKARSSAKKRARAEAAMAAEALAEAARQAQTDANGEGSGNRQRMLLSAHMSHIQVQCLCHAHLAFLQAQLLEGQIAQTPKGARMVSQMLCAQVFLNVHYHFRAELPIPPHHAGLHPTARGSTSFSDEQKSWGVFGKPRQGSSGGSGDQRKNAEALESVDRDYEELGFAQMELFDLFQRHRYKILRWLNTSPVHLRDWVMEQVVQVATVMDRKHMLSAQLSSTRHWGELPGFGGRGRFVPSMAAAPARAVTKKVQSDFDELQRWEREVDDPSLEGAEGGSARTWEEGDTYEEWLRSLTASTNHTEVNVQIGEYTLNRHRLQLMPTYITKYGDFQALFGQEKDAKSPIGSESTGGPDDAPSSFGMHCAEVKTSEYRQWFRLVGRRYDVQHWAPCHRPAEHALETGLGMGMAMGVRNSKGDVIFPLLGPRRSLKFGAARLAAGEQWILQLLPRWLKAAGMAEMQEVLTLPSVDCSGRNWVILSGMWRTTLKEVLVVRNNTVGGAPGTAASVDSIAGTGMGGVVQIFDVLEHGRRYYRSLVFTSDSACCFHDFAVPLTGGYAGIDTGAVRSSTANTVEISNASHTTMTGNPHLEVFPKPSVVMSRSLLSPLSDGGAADVKMRCRMRGRGLQIYVPARHLQGLLPTALLQEYEFWQGEDECLIGYQVSAMHQQMLLRKQMQQAMGMTRQEMLQQQQDGVASGSRSSEAGSAPPSVLLIEITALGPSDKIGLCTSSATASIRRIALVGADEDNDDIGLSASAAAPAPVSSSKATVGAVNAAASSKEGLVRGLGAAKSAASALDRYVKSITTAAANSANSAGGEVLTLLNLLHPACDKDPELSGSGASEGQNGRSSADAAAATRQGVEALARLLTRLDNMSHVLVWSASGALTQATAPAKIASVNASVDLIELPRLKLNFRRKVAHARQPDGSGVAVSRLYSVEHPGLFISTWPGTLHAARRGGPSQGVKRSTQNDLEDWLGVGAGMDESHAAGSADYGTSLIQKLLQGLPHSVLLEDDKGRFHVLLPAATLPMRHQQPGATFASELVLEHSDQNWLHALGDVRHYLYPIHASKAFLFTPTLASAMYLLLLRFLDRQYEEVFRVADSCVSDTKLSSEERQIFEQLQHLNGDKHPDAHACRLKLSLVTMGCQEVMQCPWSVPEELSLYMEKREYVSAGCRFTAAEEHALLVSCDQASIGENSLLINRLALATSVMKVLPKMVLKGTSNITSSRHIISTVDEVSRTNQVRVIFPRPPVLPIFDGIVGRTQAHSAASVAANMVAASKELCFGAIDQRAHARPWVGISYVKPQEAQPVVIPNQGTVYAMGGVQALGALNRWLWHGLKLQDNGQDTRGFMLIFELMSGGLTLSLMQGDSSHNWGCLLLRMLPESDIIQLPAGARGGAIDQAASYIAGAPSRGGGVLGVWLQLLAANRSIALTLPRFQPEKRGTIGSELEAFKDRMLRGEDDITRFLARLQMQLKKKDEAKQLVWPVPCTIERYSPAPAISLGRIPALRQWLAPRVHDYANIQQQFRALKCSKPLVRELAQKAAASLAVTCEDALAYADVPLAPLLRKCGDPVVQRSREEMGLPMVQGELPFNVSQHVSAKSSMAASILKRLKGDAQTYSQQQASTRTPQMSALFEQDTLTIAQAVVVAEEAMFVGGANSLDPQRAEALRLGQTALATAVTQVERLLAGLEQQRQVDQAFVTKGVEHVVRSANQVMPLPDAATPGASALSPTDESSRLAFVLARYSRQEYPITFELLIGLLLCSRGALDLLQLNPFISDVHAANDGRHRSSHSGDINNLDEEVLSGDHKQRLILFYQANNPARLATVDQTLAAYRGREDEMFLGLQQKYRKPVPPYRSSRDISAAANVQQWALLVLLAVSRLGQVSQCIGLGTVLLKLLHGHTETLRASFSVPATGVAPPPDTASGDRKQKRQQQRQRVKTLQTGLQLAANTLAKTLSCQRHFVSSDGDDGAALVPKTGTTEDERLFWCDPRFLVFEFTYGIMLRKSQVTLVAEFMSTINPQLSDDGTEQSQEEGAASTAAPARRNKARVHQMLMGAGKTTVVGPLLALLLGDRETLVVQVVPPALLNFSRAVMRERFSSIIQKPVYTFQFARGSAVTPMLFQKLLKARSMRAVVVAGPNAIKSFMLKFVELAHLLEQARSMEVEEEEHERVNGSVFSQVVRAMGLVQQDVWQHSGTELISSLHHQVGLCVYILGLFRDGVLLLDEVDLLLHPLKSELNWPLGQKNKLDFTSVASCAISTSNQNLLLDAQHSSIRSGLRWHLPSHLLDALFCAQMVAVEHVAAARAGGQAQAAAEAAAGEAVKHCTTCHGLEESRESRALILQLATVIQAGYTHRLIQRTPHLALLSRNYYHTEMKPLFARWLLLWMKQQRLQGLSDEDAVAYMLGGTASLVNLPGLHDVHSKMLNLGREWLHSFLPHCLSKLDRVSYGLMSASDLAKSLAVDPNMPKNRRLLAVPFVGKDVPSRNSEFAHPDVVIGMTILGYRYEGLRWTDFKRTMRLLRERMMSQNDTPYPDRIACRAFANWVQMAGGRVRGSNRYSGYFRRGMSVNGADEEDEDLDEIVPGSTPSGTPGEGLEEEEEEEDFPPLQFIDLRDLELLLQLHSLMYKLPHAVQFYLTVHTFPETMEHQNMKLSANGQDLGSDLLFERRIGFSGTPSQLLPLELGKCHYEGGSDGKMLHILTDPEVVSVKKVADDWSVMGVLDMIASADPPFQALIDTGALITGLSNQEVAQHLLSRGLSSMQGVVFLDQHDRKMILVRADADAGSGSTGTNKAAAAAGVKESTGSGEGEAETAAGGRTGGGGNYRVLELARCGVEMKKRFSFFDQVHTTGMDIPQVLDAKAVVTLGKDMSLRDYAQGAFRMRGIGEGQSLCLFVIPEVATLVVEQVALGQGQALPPMAATEAAISIASSGVASMSGPVTAQMSSKEHAQTLRDVCAWLVINSMRAEAVQFNLLCQQVHPSCIYCSMHLIIHDMCIICLFGTGNV